MLKQVVHIVTTLLERIKEETRTQNILIRKTSGTKSLKGDRHRYNNIQINLEKNGLLVEVVHYKAQWWCMGS
jgi:hypothetical protein